MGEILNTETIERPKIYLCKPNRNVIGRLKEVKELVLELNRDEPHNLTFKIPRLVTRNHQLVENRYFNLIKFKYLIKLKFNGKEEYFTILPPKKSDQDYEHLEVICKSLEDELRHKWITVIEETAVLIRDIVSKILKDTNWKVGYVPSKYEMLDAPRQSFETQSKTVLEMLYEIAESYELVIDFDTVNKLVNFYTEEEINKEENLVINDKNYLKYFISENNSEDFCTRLYVYGKDNISINAVNPTGEPYVEDFSYFIYPFQRDENRNVIEHSDYMSDELCHALLDYNELLESKKGEFADLLYELEMVRKELILLENQLFSLETELKLIEDEIEIEKKYGNDVSNLENQRDIKLQEINTQKQLINNKKSELNNVEQQITDLRFLVSKENNFTPELLEELTDYVHIDEWRNEYQYDEEQLYENGLSVLEKKKVPPTILEIEIVNFNEVVTEFRNWRKLKLGSIVRFRKRSMGINLKAYVTKIHYNFDNGDISIIVSNTTEVHDLRSKVMKRLIKSENVANELERKKWEWTGTKNELKKYIDEQITEVENSIRDFNRDLDKFSADGYLTKAEVNLIKLNADEINAEAQDLIQIAESLEIEQEVIDFRNDLSEFNNYLSVWINATEFPIYIKNDDKLEINNKFEKIQKSKLALTNKIKEKDINNAKEDMKQYTNQQIEEVNGSLNNLSDNINQYASDNFITRAEANSLKVGLQQVQSESNDIIYIAETFGIEDEKIAYETALDNLASELTKWIDKENYPIQITQTDRLNINSKFATVQEKKSELVNAISIQRELSLGGWGIVEGGIISIRNRTENRTILAKTTQNQSNYNGITEIFLDDTSQLPNSVSNNSPYILYFSGEFSFYDPRFNERVTRTNTPFRVYWTEKTSNSIKGVQLVSVYDWIFERKMLPTSIKPNLQMYRFTRPTGDVVVSPMKVIMPSKKIYKIPETVFSNHTLGANIGDVDGWEMRYIYVTTNGEVKMSSEGTEGGTNNYPSNPPDGSVRVGFMYVGYGKVEPDGNLNVDLDYDSSGFPVFKESIYHDIRYRDERIIRVEGQEVIFGDTPYGAELLNINVNPKQYRDYYILVGKGKRSINLSITLTDGSEYDNYEYGANLIVGRRSANNADGKGRPVFGTYVDADQRRGQVQGQRNTSPYGVHILSPRVWNKSYTLLYDADIMPDPNNPDRLVLKLTFHNYSSSTSENFQLKINWHAL